MDNYILEGLEQVYALINWVYLVMVITSSYGVFKLLELSKWYKALAKDHKRAFKTMVVAGIGFVLAILSYYMQFYVDVELSSNAITKKTFVESYFLTFLLEVFLYDALIKMVIKTMGSRFGSKPPTEPTL